MCGTSLIRSKRDSSLYLQKTRSLFDKTICGEFLGTSIRIKRPTKHGKLTLRIQCFCVPFILNGIWFVL